ncbi:conjugal transfer protein TrbE (plasmid) [Klebsiella grimontii]|uniref:conjugal transfer protein TrbE n=1 Tax=Klebsiella/Raoultella group TaxID=2890311 RepID=UPI0012FC26EE|nr:conjugal transfer protein TrbE [Raoultella sp. 10-1]
MPVRRIKVIVSFAKHPVVDFSLRLVLTIIIISPVVYFSWDAVKGTSGSDYIESVVFILIVGFFWLMSHLFISALVGILQKRK